MFKEIFYKMKDFFANTLCKLRGADRRKYCAELAINIGYGGKSIVSRELGVSRDTIRKGIFEVKSGITCMDAFNKRHRKRIEEDKLPNLLVDIKDILDSQSQTDPRFKTERLYTKLTVKEVKKQLIENNGYTKKELPTNQTLNTKINELGYTLKKVKPLKKINETDAIFEEIYKVNQEADKEDNVLRMSCDAKASVKIGNFSRDGKNRVETKALDHDYLEETITPFGFYYPKFKETSIYITDSKVTSDFIIDCLEHEWNTQILKLCPAINTLVINMDNGGENNSHRTQFIKRIIEFSKDKNIHIKLAYYSPYHSKYNSIERVWGALEIHWNGDLLDSKETAIKFIESMTFHGKNPTVTFIEKVYKAGCKVEKKIVKIYEKAMDRLKNLESWFVDIYPKKAQLAVSMVPQIE